MNNLIAKTRAPNESQRISTNLHCLFFVNEKRYRRSIDWLTLWSRFLFLFFLESLIGFWQDISINIFFLSELISKADIPKPATDTAITHTAQYVFCSLSGTFLSSLYSLRETTHFESDIKIESTTHQNYRLKIIVFRNFSIVHQIISTQYSHTRASMDNLVNNFP